MYLVFDVGGTFIKYALMSEDGKMTEKGKRSTPIGKGQGVSDFVEVIGEIYDGYRDRGEELAGIAMGLPGQIDVERGIVYSGGSLKYLDKICLKELLEKRCDGIRISMENDGKCAALAEVWLGNAKDAVDACVLVYGTGIGGGIVKDRKIHRGNRLFAGEVSFCFGNMTMEELEKVEREKQIEEMTLEESFEKLSCMWSTYSSTGALSYRVAKAKGLSYEEVNGELIYQWIEEGDEQVRNIMEDEYFTIAKQCMTIYAIYDPDVILIGGGISVQTAFLDGIRRYVKRLGKISKVYDNVRIEPCKFHNDSNLLGALYHFLQMYGQV